MTPAATRMLAALGTVAALVIVLAIWLAWDPGTKDEPPVVATQPGTEPVVVPPAPAPPPQPARAPAPAPASPAPAPSGPDAESSPPAPAPVPNPNADFTLTSTDRLQAELAQMADLSPTVKVVSASCEARPCSAQATGTDLEELNGYVARVHARFAGHVATAFEVDHSPTGTIITAKFTIGTPEPQPVARFSR